MNDAVVVLMERVGSSLSRAVVIFSPEDEPPYRHEHYLPNEIWEMLDRPNEITVTIAPGDKMDGGPH